jgi:hypothetical protein
MIFSAENLTIFFQNASHTSSTNMAELCTEHVALDAPLTPLAIKHIIGEFFKFILFQRQQIPAPFDQFADGLNDVEPDVDDETRRRIRLPSARERASKALVATMHNLFDVLHACPVPPSEVLIVLGSSIVSAREIYLLRLRLSPDSHDTENSKAASNSARAFLRHLITSSADCFSRSAKVSNVHILFGFPSNVEHIVPPTLFLSHSQLSLRAKSSLKCAMQLLVGEPDEFSQVPSVLDLAFASSATKTVTRRTTFAFLCDPISPQMAIEPSLEPSVSDDSDAEMVFLSV